MAFCKLLNFIEGGGVSKSAFVEISVAICKTWEVSSESVAKLIDKGFAELVVYARKIVFNKIVFGTDYPLYSAKEYLNILKTRLKLSDKEIDTMLKN